VVGRPTQLWSHERLPHLQLPASSSPHRPRRRVPSAGCPAPRGPFPPPVPPPPRRCRRAPPAPPPRPPPRPPGLCGSRRGPLAVRLTRPDGGRGALGPVRRRPSATRRSTEARRGYNFCAPVVHST